MKHRRGEFDIDVVRRVGFRTIQGPCPRPGTPYRFLVHVFNGPLDADRVAVYGATREGDFYGWGWVMLPRSCGRSDVRKWSDFLGLLLDLQEPALAEAAG